MLEKIAAVLARRSAAVLARWRSWLQAPGRRSGRAPRWAIGPRSSAIGPRSSPDRLRRRTLAPSRPLLYPDQVGLALFSLLAIAGGIYAVARLLF